MVFLNFHKFLNHNSLRFQYFNYYRKRAHNLVSISKSNTIELVMSGSKLKALLLRVGIDKGYGGCLAPIFEDGTFEYIPIPERSATLEKMTYEHLTGRYKKTLLEYLPKRLYNSVPHFDPEFKTFTYGDPARNKSRQLARLEKDDLLIFYSGLEHQNKVESARLYIIGYFLTKEVFNFRKISKSDLDSALDRLRENAHIKRDYLDDDLVIVQGDSKRSKLLSKALPLGDGKNNVLKDSVPIFGYDGSILRSIGHWIIKEAYLKKIKDYLENGVSILVSKDTNMFSYVLRWNTGFAPNITGGYCTLVCSKPKIRKKARIGDWVIGTLSKSSGPDKLVYVMRVNEALSFDEYFRDKRFENKKPTLDPKGDNIYYKENERYIQLKNDNHPKKHLQLDTSVDRVLISSLFWYFGNKSPKIPNEFRSLMKSGSEHKREKNPILMKNFVSWLSSNYRPGIHN